MTEDEIEQACGKLCGELIAVLRKDVQFYYEQKVSTHVVSYILTSGMECAILNLVDGVYTNPKKALNDFTKNLKKSFPKYLRKKHAQAEE